MCGIAGLIGDRDVGKATQRVEQSLLALNHRGPDGAGLFIQAPGAGGARLTTSTIGHAAATIELPQCGADSPPVIIGHRRLAILDPTPRAAQPMVTADGRHVLAFNGEIYNFPELRSELETLGERFVTTSDTEVLLKACVRWDVEVLDRLVGMFAFALLDRHAQTLLLARDPFGMKPLYWGGSPSTFAFASEPAALLTLIDVPRTADARSLADYLVLGLTDHRPETMFSGVHSLPAASWLRVALRSFTVLAPRQYWRASIDHVDDRPPDRIACDLRDRLLDSIRLHLRSDVRVGTLLSGGIDSSSIVMAARAVAGPHVDLHTFSFIPDEGTVSEESWIDQVNSAADAIPCKVRITREEWEREAPVLAHRQGEPFGTLAVYAQSRLYRAASEQGVKVLLDGQGADEIFAGYAQFRGVRIAAHLRRYEVRRAARVIQALGREWSMSHAVAALTEALRIMAPAPLLELTRQLASTPNRSAQPWLTKQRINIRGWRPEGARVLQERLREAIEVSSLPALLRYADRGSMMHGVESRLPFVTRELVEFAMALPDHLLMSEGGLGKTILRQALRGIVPDTVLDRREKIGFAVPLYAWLVGSAYVEERLTAAAALPCVNANRVRILGGGGAASRREIFLAWRLLGLSEWTRQYGIAIP
jgi:asparagine synthase (glutamine-hydrolysing)